MNKGNLTGLVIAKNEANDLPGCLDFLNEVCTQTIVVDDSSADSTVDIAKSFGCKVIATQMDDSTGFMGLRNTGLDHVQTEMTLVLDPDERPDAILAESIRKAKEETFYQVFRRNNVFGNWLDYGRFGNDHQIRLFPSHTRYQGIVHETPVLPDGANIEHLEGTLNHYTYTTLDEYTDKMVRYASKLADCGKTPSLVETIKNVSFNTIKRKAYLDGSVGLFMIMGDIWHDSVARKRAKILKKS